jgi:hypothetical protein
MTNQIVVVRPIIIIFDCVVKRTCYFNLSDVHLFCESDFWILFYFEMGKTIFSNLLIKKIIA